jgi:(E)-4-hydroxy-3-methylbut-2-enyl-diphosphate synthase
LGVTEAGDGEDGRIKSAVGIGALLEDGIGDTIRVSLTEEPEFEIPVARKLVEKYQEQNIMNLKENEFPLAHDPFSYQRRESSEIHNIGGKHVPVVIADMSQKTELSPANFYGFGYTYSVSLDKWNLQDLAADYVYIGSNSLDFEVPGTLGVICNYALWQEQYSTRAGFYPLITTDQLSAINAHQTAFLALSAEEEIPNNLTDFTRLIVVLSTKFDNKTQLFRRFFSRLSEMNSMIPVILQFDSAEMDVEKFQLNVSSDAGAVLIDGYGDGIWIKASQPSTLINSTAFGILQATRTRISKTEYISCPSCGRTLFDLQETTAKIRERTSHLKGIKIGIMGCIVNGPGEMADADYGYVGTGPGKIHLYKEKTVVRKNVAAEEAVDALIELIKEHGDWVDQVL